MKLCKDCRNFSVPRNCRSGVDVVDGSPELTPCDDMRASGGPCGPEARMWWGKALPEPTMVENVSHI